MKWNEPGWLGVGWERDGQKMERRWRNDGRKDRREAQRTGMWRAGEASEEGRSLSGQEVTVVVTRSRLVPPDHGCYCSYCYNNLHSSGFLLSAFPILMPSLDVYRAQRLWRNTAHRKVQRPRYWYEWTQLRKGSRNRIVDCMLPLNYKEWRRIYGSYTRWNS